MRYRSEPSNYDKFPSVAVPAGSEPCLTGWYAIIDRLRTVMDERSGRYLVVECYNGVCDSEVAGALQAALPDFIFIDTATLMKTPAEIARCFHDDITDDEIFGFLTRHNVDAYFDDAKLSTLHTVTTDVTRKYIFYGVGATLAAPCADVLVYADMSRWEIQRRFRNNQAGNIGAHNEYAGFQEKYKRGYFIDWRICDRLKKRLMLRCDFLLDTNTPGSPKMATGADVRLALAHTARRPFRVVPFFDPGPWGGQWMKEIFDLNPAEPNYAWCFDCVPEENSLLLRFPEATIELPAIDLVLAQPRELLGEAVHARFGDEFPIRFDFLDTMGGGNLSLQVHPLTEYIQEKFGMHYTQDESYYIMDAAPDAVVYLGLLDGIDPAQMISGLYAAQNGGEAFDAGRYVGVYPVRTHDHVLIPAGTVHCSGRNCVVLEISSTPYIFTFKLWDWGRLGLDGRPRPIKIGHGEKVIQWDRTENWVRPNLLERTRIIASGNGWTEEFTGLHEREFIETRRFRFTGPTHHDTAGNLNVLNLVEGREAIVESPEGYFEPFVVHYAETFIVPASVGEYIIRPVSEERCSVIKAFVRINP